MTQPHAPSVSRQSGLLFALLSAAGFGASGPFMKPLLEAGWSPAAAVAARAGFAGLVLLVPALIALGGRYRVLRKHAALIVAYGLIAVLGTQVLYFAAIERMPVGVALLLEYMAPVLLVLLAWGRTRRPPAATVIVGTLLSIGGLVLVIDPTGVGDLDPVGVAFAVGAAVCLACYFLLSGTPTDGLPPVVLVCAGLFVGSAALLITGVTGLLPLTVTLESVTLLGADGVPWFVPFAVVVLFSTSFSYLTGLVGAARLGSRVASFVGLSEVLFAVLLSWLLLGEVPTLMQALGGALVVGGIVAIKLERTAAVEAATVEMPALEPEAELEPEAGAGSRTREPDPLSS
jgi:drug/metabolite transporter (DMT)-like permease